MLPGFNHNLRHRGAIFHIQTEDGGRSDPRILTQLFIGGRLLKVDRRSYSALLSSQASPHEIEAAIRERMMAQHKSMLKRVALGEFDGALGFAAESIEITEAPTLDVPMTTIRQQTAEFDWPDSELQTEPALRRNPPPPQPSDPDASTHIAPAQDGSRQPRRRLPSRVAGGPKDGQVRRSERVGHLPPRNSSTRRGRDTALGETVGISRRQLESAPLTEDELLAEIDAELRRHERAPRASAKSRPASSTSRGRRKVAQAAPTREADRHRGSRSKKSGPRIVGGRPVISPKDQENREGEAPPLEDVILDYLKGK